MERKTLTISIGDDLLDKIENYRTEQKPPLTKGQYIERACWEKINRDERKQSNQ